MKKKILCAIVSAVMAVGTLVGCSSSSSNPSSDTVDKDNDKSSKVEQTILTELIPGETTAEETKKWFQDNDIITETDGGWKAEFTDNFIPYYSKAADTFLGYNCYYGNFQYVNEHEDRENDASFAGLDDDTITRYSIFVVFKDRDDFKEGKKKIENYVKSLSSTKAVHDADTYGDKASILIKDEDKYATEISILPKELRVCTSGYLKEVDTTGYYETTLMITFSAKTDIRDWELPDGTKFDLKCKDFVQSNK